MLDIKGVTKELTNKEITDFVNQMTLRYFGVKPDKNNDRKGDKKNTN